MANNDRVMEMQGFETIPEDQEDTIYVRDERGELTEVEVMDDAEHN